MCYSCLFVSQFRISASHPALNVDYPVTIETIQFAVSCFISHKSIRYIYIIMSRLEPHFNTNYVLVQCEAVQIGKERANVPSKLSEAIRSADSEAGFSKATVRCLSTKLYGVTFHNFIILKNSLPQRKPHILGTILAIHIA